MSQRALHFEATRRQRGAEVVEDYTELIAELLDKGGKVRICDIAKEMGISHVSVLKTLRKLVRDGFVEQDSGIVLTDKGLATARLSKHKHLVLMQFLQKIGVPEDIAACDAEGIEHHISQETLDAIETFVNNPEVAICAK